MTTFNPTQDIYIPLGFGNQDTFGLTIGYHNGKFETGEDVSIMDFDLSSLAGQTVTAAQLDFYCGVNGTGSHPMYLDKILRTDWVETQATYAIYKTATNWQTNLAAGANDRDNNGGAHWVTGGNMPTAGTAYTIADSAALRTFVQNGITAGTLRVRMSSDITSGGEDYWQFADSEDATSAHRPLLTVTATAAAGLAPKSLIVRQAVNRAAVY